MGSVKKKLTKTLRKITPKEIAPVLPFLAMAIPGMQAFASPLLRYGLPQLLTAAGSARTSGEINPLNQALAAFSSYAAGPATGASTTQESAFLKDAATGGQGGTAGVMRPTYAGGLQPATTGPGITLTKGMTAQQAAAANPEAFQSFLKANPNVKNTFLESINKSLVRPVGKGIQGIGQGEFNLRNIGTVAALGATPAGIDAAKKYEKEQEELAAYEAGLYDDYDSAVQEYIAAMSGMQADPGRLYGLPNLFAAEGGRVGLKDGGNKLFGPAKEGYGMSKSLGAGLASLLGTGAFSMYEFLEPIISGARDAGLFNKGGRVSAQEGGMMNTAPGMPPGMQVDGRKGTFIPMGVKEKADDVPAMLSKNEFVMTADAVKAAGGGSVNKGAQRMYDLMNNLEAMV